MSAFVANIKRVHTRSKCSRRKETAVVANSSSFIDLYVVCLLNTGMTGEIIATSNTARSTGDFSQASANNSRCAACELHLKVRRHSDE